MSHAGLRRFRSCDRPLHRSPLHIRLSAGRAQPGKAEGRPVGLRVQEEPLLWPEEQEEPLPWQVGVCLCVSAHFFKCSRILDGAGCLFSGSAVRQSTGRTSRGSTRVSFQTTVSIPYLHRAFLTVIVITNGKT